MSAITEGAAASARPALAAPGSACGTGHIVEALYVGPDGSYEAGYWLTGHRYSRYEPPAGQHPGGERAFTLSADIAEARLLSPTWQDAARAIRPCLRGLPPAVVEAYARALLDEVRRSAFNRRCPFPAPFEYPQDYAHALITAACEALRHGDQAHAASRDVAAARKGPGGKWEISPPGITLSIPAIIPREQDNARRPALRLVHEPCDAPASGEGE